MKKIYLFLLTAMLAVTLCMPILAAEDARDVGFETELAADLKALGLFSGVSDTDFDLLRAPTRTEVLVMLIRVLGEEQTALGGTWEHPFTDVPSWANPYVGYAYANGLTSGISKTEFGNGTANAATYLTFMLRALGYSDADGDFRWDSPFALAKGLGLLPSMVDTENFLRADIVTVSYAALSMEKKDSTELLYASLVEKGAIAADVFASTYNGTKLTVRENKDKPVLSAEDIYDACSPAVFYIEIQSADGTPLSSGSGFFLDQSGIAVTNWHVMDGAEKAVVTLAGSGEKHEVTGLYYMSLAHDVAVIQVEGSGFATLAVNPLPIKGAASVYAIGSPKGLQNTISTGIVSNARRVIDGDTYIQTSAAISNGSSGGVLLNTHGEVIGITSASLSDGQNLNFARPIAYIAPAKTESATPLADVNWNFVSYSLREDAYTLAAGEELSLEFDVTYYTKDGSLPVFTVTSDNPAVCVATAEFDDTFVRLYGVQAGSANITITDSHSDSSVTFPVTVTDGAAMQPHVAYLTGVESLSVRKDMQKTFAIDAVCIGMDGTAEIEISVGNTRIAEAALTTHESGTYFCITVTGKKNGSTTLTVKNTMGEDTLQIPITVGDPYATAFAKVCEIVTLNGAPQTADGTDKVYYSLEGTANPYSSDMPYLLYYPEQNELYLRIVSTQSTAVTVDIRLSADKTARFAMEIPSQKITASGEIDAVSFTGGAPISFTEYTGTELYRASYEALAPTLTIMVLATFDGWLDNLVGGMAISDFGFTALDIAMYKELLKIQ